MHNRSSLTSGIFYPEDREKLISMLRNFCRAPSDAPVPLPAALFIPHAAYDRTLIHIGAACSAITSESPSRIILLAPIHADILQEDRPHTIFCTNNTRIETPLGSLLIEKESTDYLTSHYGKDVAIGDYYFQEEPSIGLAAPLITYRYPETEVLPLLVGGSSAKTAAALATILNELTDKKTLIILSMNLSAWDAADRSLLERKLLIEQLTAYTGAKRPPLLDLYQKKQIRTCGIVLLEALHRTGMCTGPWNILSTEESDKRQLPLLEKNKKTQYGSGIMSLHTQEMEC